MGFFNKRASDNLCPECRGRGLVEQVIEVDYADLPARTQAEAMVLGGSVAVRKTLVRCDPCTGRGVIFDGS